MPARSTVLLIALLICLSAIATPVFAQQLPRAEGTSFRFVSWNVAREKFIEETDALRQVLTALDADVIMIDELPSPVTDASLAAFADSLPGGPYRSVLGVGGGNYQRAAILARAPVHRQAAFDALRYPDAATRPWLDGAGDLRRALANNLALGIPVAGADVSLGERSILIVGMDLQCCGNQPGAWEEERRLVETREIRTAIDSIWQGQAAAIVSGDFNNVQGMAPLDVLAGKDRAPAARQLVRAEAVRPDGKTDWTWDGRGTEFPSRAMDHVMYSPALEVLNATVFDTESLDAPTRESLGVDADLSRRCSDHRPIVVDFRWR